MNRSGIAWLGVCCECGGVSDRVCPKCNREYCDECAQIEHEADDTCDWGLSMTTKEQLDEMPPELEARRKG